MFQVQQGMKICEDNGFNFFDIHKKIINLSVQKGKLLALRFRIFIPFQAQLKDEHKFGRAILPL